jgi:DNA polymerase III subunit epsilon
MLSLRNGTEKRGAGMSVKEPIVIIDFETTGLSPLDSRTIEVGALLIDDNRIVDTFSQLMNPGYYIPSFISAFTGITNEMVENQPSPENVMPKLRKFIGNHPLMAHNASFDSKFLISEMQRADIRFDNPFLCTLKLSRRLIQDAHSHSLSNLAAYLGLDTDDINQMHRALDDVKVTFRLWKHLQNAVVRQTGIPEHTLDIFFKIIKKPRKKVKTFLEGYMKDESE